jgi:beta-galactosidase
MNRRTFCAILPAAGTIRPAEAASPEQPLRERLLLDHDWRFLLGDPDGAEAPAFGVAAWRILDLPGKPLEVEIYSRAEAVRLYVGGRPIAQKPTTRAERFMANFRVPYAPGVLRAVALQGGKPVAEAVLRTVGEPMRVRLTADRASLRANGQDLAFVTVEAVDANGQPHPNADHPVSFRLKGPGTIAAVGSGDLNNEEPYQGNRRKLFHGKALVVVRTRRTAGALALTASAPGLKQATIQLASRG